MASSPSPKGTSGPNRRTAASRVEPAAPEVVAARAPPRGPSARSCAVRRRPSSTTGMTGTDRIVWICLHLLVLLVPVAMSNFNWLGRLTTGGSMLPLTYDQFDIVKVFVMRACALGPGAWAFQFFFKGGKLRRTKLDWLIVGFLGWVLLTSFTSISPATALFGKYRRFEGSSPSSPTRSSTSSSCSWSTARAASSRCTRTFLFSEPDRVRLRRAAVPRPRPDVVGRNLPFEANRAFSTFGNPDLLGGFLIFPLAISAALALSERNINWRVFYWLAFLVTAYTWFVAFVRGAWLGGGAALIVLVIAVRRGS